MVPPGPVSRSVTRPARTQWAHRPSALAAGVVDVVPGARPADAGAVAVAGDQRLGGPAAGACGRGPQHRGVAGLADRPDRPVGHHRKITLAAGAGHAWPLVTGVTGAADRKSVV